MAPRLILNTNSHPVRGAYLVLHFLEQHLPVALHRGLSRLHRQAFLCFEDWGVPRREMGHVERQMDTGTHPYTLTHERAEVETVDVAEIYPNNADAGPLACGDCFDVGSVWWLVGSVWLVGWWIGWAIVRVVSGRIVRLHPYSRKISFMTSAGSVSRPTAISTLCIQLDA